MDLDGRLICIFGGGGFVGRYIAQALLERGARLRIAERNISNAMHIKPLGNLGQTQFVSADITKPDSVARAVRGSDVVINLVGVLKGDFERIHVEGARNVAQAAAAAGCHSLLHLSAIGADSESPSRYGRSKADGEKAVRTAFPDAIILRPSIIFGREDQFINRFAAMIAMLPVVPVIGSKTKFQPIFAGDVADVAAAALGQPERHAGQTFELGGPEILSMGEINRRIAQMTGRKPTFIDVPDVVAGLMASVLGPLPGAPITADQYRMLQKDNVVSPDASGIDAFGVVPTPIAAVAPGWMEKYTPHGRFGASVKAG